MAQNGTDPITEYQMVARICGAVAYARYVSEKYFLFDPDPLSDDISYSLPSLIGFEREAKNKPASVRMHMMVAAGSATFVGTALMNTVLWNLGDVNRVAAGVASGVGFLGAATITKKEDRIDGLNTASGIWLVAAIGFTVANGYWMIGLLVTLLAVVTQFGALFFLTPGNCYAQ